MLSDDVCADPADIDDNVRIVEQRSGCIALLVDASLIIG